MKLFMSKILDMISNFFNSKAFKEGLKKALWATLDAIVKYAQEEHQNKEKENSEKATD